MIECIIFDCDGTLVDSEYLGNFALASLLAELGIVETAVALLTKYRGRQLAHILQEIEARHDISFDSSFVPRYRELVSQLFVSKLEPIEGIRNALEAITLPMCIASGGPQEKIRQALQITRLTPYFQDNIFSAYDIQIWKPEPDLFLKAANAMGVAPSRCAVVEDSAVGIEAAKRAGMIPFLYDPSRQSFQGDADHTVFHDMADLPALISRSNAESHSRI